jgi:hypothetical protein
VITVSVSFVLNFLCEERVGDTAELQGNTASAAVAGNNK